MTRDGSTVEEQPINLCSINDKFVAFCSHFLNERAKDNLPFFLYVALTVPHQPLAHAPQFTGKSNRGTIFGDTLLEMDDTVKRIMDSVISNNLEDNTLVILMGDNGPWDKFCEVSGSPGPYTGDWLKANGGGGVMKFSAWEGGHRVASVFSWPGKIAPKVSNTLTSALDIMPTVAVLAGASLPKDRHYDGLDLTQLLFNDGDDDVFVSRGLAHPAALVDPPFNLTKTGAFRLGDYKVFYTLGGTHSVGCDGIKRSYEVLHPPLLFDLSKDIAEANSIDPNSAEYKKAFAEIDAAFDAYLDDVKADKTTLANFETGDELTIDCCSNREDHNCACQGT